MRKKPAPRDRTQGGRKHNQPHPTTSTPPAGLSSGVLATPSDPRGPKYNQQEEAMGQCTAGLTRYLEALREQGVLCQLTRAELATFLTILSHAHPPEWTCSAGVAAIANAAGTTLPSCLRALRRLRQLGLVQLDSPTPWHPGAWRILPLANATGADGRKDQDTRPTSASSRPRETGQPEHPTPLQLFLWELDRNGRIGLLTHRQARILLVLLARAHQELVHTTIGQLARAARMDHKAAGKSLSSLEAVGLIKRYFRRGRGHVGTVRLLIPGTPASDCSRSGTGTSA